MGGRGLWLLHDRRLELADRAPHVPRDLLHALSRDLENREGGSGEERTGVRILFDVEGNYAEICKVHERCGQGRGRAARGGRSDAGGDRREEGPRRSELVLKRQQKRNLNFFLEATFNLFSPL